MPFFSRPQHSTDVSRRPCCAVVLRRNAWSKHGMASVNQTRPQCVNQMGKPHSKPLAARHGRGTTWHIWIGLKWFRTALFWVIMHPISSGRGFLTPWKMGPIGCPKTSVQNYHYSLRKNPEGRSSHLLRGGSLKSSLTGYYEVWKGNKFTVHLFWVIYFQSHRKRLLDLESEVTKLLQNVT